MDTYCIYKHTNLKNNKVYIGMTNNIKRRWRNCGIEYKPAINRHSIFWNAIKKYGWNNFSHIIIEDGLSFEEACRKEIELISHYKSTDRRYGYNIAKGGNGGKVYKSHPRGMKGKHQTNYQIKSQKAMLMNHQKNPMTNGMVVWDKTHAHPRGMKGKHQTLAHREAMKLKNSGKNSKTKKSFSIEKPNGQILHFDTIKEFVDKYKAWQIYKILKGPQPYHVTDKSSKSRKKYEQFEGCIFKYDEV